MNWRQAREESGSIRIGQTWRHRRTQQLLVVKVKHGSRWRLSVMGKGTTHSVDERVLYKYFELMP